MRIAVVAALLAALSATAQTEIPDVIVCAAGDIGCDATRFGALDTSDCILENGARADAYRLPANDDQIITATVRSLSPDYAVPGITLVPPSGEGMRTATTVGGAGATIRYRVDSPGDWHVVVGSTDPASLGAYVSETHCSDRETLYRDCLGQQILCGQTFTGNLSVDGCRFRSAPDRGFELHSIYGEAGDVFDIELESADFQPSINVYAWTLGDPLVRSAPGVNGRAELKFTVPSSGMYEIAALTPPQNFNFGRYALRVKCERSGCLRPLVFSQPEVIEVSYGNRATLAVDVHHVGPVEYLWFQFRDFPELLGKTTVPQFQTGPITNNGFYYVTARSPCGSSDSETMAVTVKSRRRSARH